MIHWNIQPFSELAPDTLYAILQLRSEVFVVEQQCIYLDPDNKDQEAFHLTGWQDGSLVAYARLSPATALQKPVLSIGRVATRIQIRRLGIGKKLMETAIETSYTLFGRYPIQISAQLYLQKFYESFGFTICGTQYQEDGIPHIKMEK